jgi:hypothetical protein
MTLLWIWLGSFVINILLWLVIWSIKEKKSITKMTNKDISSELDGALLFAMFILGPLVTLLLAINILISICDYITNILKSNPDKNFWSNFK